MGDMSSGGGMGKSASAMGAGAPADSSGGLGLGGDPMAGGFDPTGGMGGSLDPMSGFGGDPTGGAFGGIDPSTQASLAMQGPQGMTQPPITDQPSTPAAGAPQAAPAPPPQPPQLDKAQALFRGMNAHPEWGFNQTSEAPWTPGGQEARLFDPETGQTIRTDAPVVNEPYRGLDPKTDLGGQTQPVPLPPERPDIHPAIIEPSSDPTSPGVHWLDTAPQPGAGPGVDILRPSVTAETGTPEKTGLRMPDTAGGDTGLVPPTSTASQGPMLAQGAIPDNLKTGTAGGGTTPGATPQVTPPGTSAPAGAGMQSPLEQIVSQFLHMLTGQGMGALQQLIGRFLGINPRQLFPQFYGGGFNRPAGPGYFPAGTTGGRAIGPNAQPASLQTPQAPAAPPGSPQTPQAPRSTLPSSRREFDPTLPGPPYTAQSRDRPPPWYHPERNPAARGRGTSTPQAHGRDVTGMRGGVPRQDIPYNGTPASIRYNNPGAQFPSAAAKKFGMTGYGVLGHSKITGEPLLIARFPDAQHGAAANMDLFARKYTGKTIGQAGKDWTGSYSSGVPGYNPHMVITRQMFNDPNFVIPFMKALTGREAGRASPLTDGQWQQAFDLYQAGGEPATAVGF